MCKGDSMYEKKKINKKYIILIAVFVVAFVLGITNAIIMNKENLSPFEKSIKDATLAVSKIIYKPVEFFKNKIEFNKRYIVEKEKGVLKNFSLMPIMDLDDTSEDKKQKYISGEMFKNHWLNPYIIPIWNKNNLDEVLLDLKLIDKLPNNKEKGRLYRDLFPTNNGESDIQQVKNLMEKFEKSTRTNMQVFIKKCLDSL